jgi:SAM-dependent methyltransferase
MIRFTPSRDSGEAERALALLVRPRVDPLPFASRIRGLRRMSSAYTACCPAPWASPGLHITPEITYQSELWLPLDQLRKHFHTLYRHSLTYPPILSSSPLAHGTSWAAIVADFPEYLKPYYNPAALLEQLVVDNGLRMRFLFWSFMPGRFYGGGSDRYPAQSAAITEWLRRRGRHGRKMRCLDAACGDGAATYGLARLCAENGRPPDSFEIEGWTLEPLEAWAAAHGRFPHEPVREALYREETGYCIEKGFDRVVRFCCANILNVPAAEPFDLIICNGLLGGPILNLRADMETAVCNLAGLLAPGGMLLAADHFHGGWKQKCPQQELRALMRLQGLEIVETAEGVAGLAPQAG